MDQDDYLMMSGIQHFSFCRRQWALIHLEQQWSENLRTVEGRLLHERCHDDSLREKRGDLLIVRGMRAVSHQLRFLKDAGMVRTDRHGKIIFYSLSNEIVNDVLLKGVEFLGY